MESDCQAGDPRGDICKPIIAMIIPSIPNGQLYTRNIQQESHTSIRRGMPHEKLYKYRCIKANTYKYKYREFERVQRFEMELRASSSLEVMRNGFRRFPHIALA